MTDSAPGPLRVECWQIAELLGDYLERTLPRETRELNTYCRIMDSTRKLADVRVRPR
jgi:hypothetical protein